MARKTIHSTGGFWLILGALLLALAVLLAAATVLRCKPKDILSQME